MENNNTQSHNQVMNTYPSQPVVERNNMFDVIQALSSPFNNIKKNYQGFDYVSVGDVVKRLNEVLTPFGWDFVIIREKIVVNETTNQVDSVYVVGELTVMGKTKSCIGTSIYVSTNKQANISDAVKNASSDCLKKCASWFGIPCVINTQKGNNAQQQKQNYSQPQNNSQQNYNPSQNYNQQQQNNSQQQNNKNYVSQCNECGYGVDQNIVNFSLKKFNKILCLNCQKKH